MKQQDIDKFIETIQNSKFVSDCANRKRSILVAFKSDDLANEVKSAQDSMKRFGDKVRV